MSTITKRSTKGSALTHTEVDNNFDNLNSDKLETTNTVSITTTNVITGATVEATGDTSAGDNAALGYTATEGAILTGQGSTNDVTIKNDADAAVISIPTGTTNVDIVGVATAETFEPDGDTSSGDNAAIGYTATEGIIITGQGSVNDITIKNDADARVARVITGTTDWSVDGDVSASTFLPSSSTSASDPAALGYDATGGVVLTGQGMVNDVTIKNDADQDVLVIPTGTKYIEFDQTTADAPFINFKATADGDATSAISTNTTSGSVTHHIQISINGTTAWIPCSTTDPS